MDIIKFSGSLDKHNIVYSAVQKISLKIKEIPQYELLKLSHDLTKYTCCLLENFIDKKYNIDKKQVAIDLLTELYNLNKDEIHNLENQIDFLISIKAIKKLSFYKRFKYYTTRIFLKQLQI